MCVNRPARLEETCSDISVSELHGHTEVFLKAVDACNIALELVASDVELFNGVSQNVLEPVQ